MNYQQTLDYLYTQLPMFTRIGSAAYKADLHNIIALCNALQNPEKNFKSIHIAGTNGKGSCSNMLASILQEAGYKVGLYTSPHIKDFRERIRINGKKIDEQFVIKFTEKIKNTVENIQPSFFEITVAMAFDYFAKNNIDIAIVETGIGGLLDSTNIILPVVSLITNIGYDHTNLLGITLQEIALQKAGIIKENTPVVISESHSETDRIFTNKALEKNAHIVFADKVFDVVITDNNLYNIQKIKVVNKAKLTIENFELDLLGNYQTKNCKSVLMVVDILQNKNWKISTKNIFEGLKNVKKNTDLKGRFDIINHQPKIICDVAHNIDGITILLNQIENIKHHQLHIIMGFVSDKDVEKVLQIMPQKAKYYYTQAHIPRALPKEKLMEIALKNNLIGFLFEDVNLALDNAKLIANDNDIILILGSFFILAELNNYAE